MGRMGLLATLVQGSLGCAYSQITWVAWMIPRRENGGEKSKLRNLDCRRFVFSPTHSPGDCIQDPPYPCPVIRCQKVFGSSATIDSRYNVSEGKNFRNLLEA
jgi:hypothetical protein